MSQRLCAFLASLMLFYGCFEAIKEGHFSGRGGGLVTFAEDTGFYVFMVTGWLMMGLFFLMLALFTTENGSTSVVDKLVSKINKNNKVQ